VGEGGYRWVVAPQISEINLGSSAKPQTQIYLHENCALYSLSSSPPTLHYSTVSVLYSCSNSAWGGGALQVLLNALGMELCRDDLC
jgi:hypothetical protein